MSMVDDYCSSSRYRYRERERERAKGQPRHTSIDPAGEDRRESSSRRENRTGRRVVRKRVAATASGRMGRSILRFFARRQRPCDILHNYTRGHVTKTPHTQRADIDLLLNWRADTQKIETNLSSLPAWCWAERNRMAEEPKWLKLLVEDVVDWSTMASKDRWGRNTPPRVEGADCPAR